MSNLLVSPKWNSFINKVDAGEEITGGDFGNANIATRQLAENVMFLRDSMFTLVTDATTDLTETVENLEVRTKGEFDKIANEIATQNSLIIAETKARQDEVSLANAAIAKEAADRLLALDETNASLQTEIDERKAAIRAENLSRAESEAKFTQTLEETLDKNEAAVTKIDNLSAQLVGGYDGSDLDFITEGLLFQQKNATATALKGMSEQISMLSAGVGEQFDLKEIWHFTKDTEEWVNGTFETGYLTVKNETITSPVFDVDGDVYHHLKMRINRIGSPTWQGLLTWEGGSISIPTPIFIEDITVVTLDTKWVGNITQMQLKLATVADADNFYKIDWISIGRPSPGASTAGLLEVKQASATRDEALAQSIAALDTKLNTDNALLSSTLNTKIETLTTEQQTQATEITNIKSTVETLDQELSAEITLNNNTLVTKQTALAESIAALQSSTDDAAATLVTDLKTLTDKDTALANQITALTASLDTAKAGIVTQNKVFADKDTALTNSITQLTSKVDGNIAEVNTKIETITTDNSAAASKFDSLTAQFDDLVLNVDTQELEIRKNAADIITNEQVRAEADLAQSERIDLLTAEVGTNAASATQRINTLVTADAALSERLDVLSAKTDSSEATVNSRLTALAEADLAFTEQVTQLIAEVDGNAAAANEKFTALTDTDNSLAEQLTQLTADFGSNSAAITAQLKTLSDKDSSQASQLSGLSADFAIVDTRSQQTAADLVDVNGELIAAKKIISKNTADLKLEQTARADQDASIVQSITNLTATVAGNKSDIDVKYNTTTDAVSANASAILALKGTVGENKVAADQQFTAIVSAAQAEATKLETLSGKVGTNTTKISQETAARTTADEALGNRITTVEGKTDNALSRITTAETTIANNTGAITQQKTDITAAYKQAIDDIEVGGRNLILNSNSIHVSPNNTGLGTSAIMNDEDYPYFRITANTQISTYESAIFSWMKSNATIGEEYTISVDVRIPIAGDVGFYVWKGSQRVIADKWTKISYTFVYSGDRVSGLSYGANTLDYRNWKLEKGNKATDWTPAPEDVEADYNAKISTEATARTNADTTLTNLITTLDTDYQGNKTAIRNELTAVSNKVDSTANSLSTLTTTVGGNTTRISEESAARSDADTAIGNRITTVEGKTDNALSRIATVETAVANANSSIAQTKTDLIAEFVDKNNLYVDSDTVGGFESLGSIVPYATAHRIMKNLVKISPHIDLKIEMYNPNGTTFGNFSNRIAFFNKDKVHIGSIEVIRPTQSTYLEQVITPPDNSAFIRIGVIKDDSVSYIVTQDTGTELATNKAAISNVESAIANTNTALATQSSTLSASLEVNTLDNLVISSVPTHGVLVYPDVDFSKPGTDINRYDNAYSGKVSVSVRDKTSGNPSSSPKELRITIGEGAAPGFGGFHQSIYGAPKSTYVVKYIMKIPVGFVVKAASNSLGDGGSIKLLGKLEGTGFYESITKIVRFGTGSIANAGFIYFERLPGYTMTTSEVILSTIETYNVTSFIGSSVNSKDLSSSINNIEIGARNLIANSNDITFNGDDGNGNGGRTTTATNNEYKYITAAVTGYVYGFATVIDQLYPNEYTFSIEVYTNFATSMFFRLDGTKDGQIRIPNTGNKWQRVDFTFNTYNRLPANHSFLLGFESIPAGNTIHWRGIQLVKGNKATSWTPAPEDAMKLISGTVETINRVEATVSGIKAEASVLTTVGNKVSGWKNLNTGVTSNFDVWADRFTVWNGYSNIAPFTINGSSIEMNIPLKANSSITSPYINGGNININNNFIVDSAGNLTAKAGRFEGTVLANKIEGKVANIADLAVDTLQIAGNAITASGIYYAEQDEHFNIAKTPLEVAFLNIDSSGGTVSIDFGLDSMRAYRFGGTSSSLVIQVLRGTEVLREKIYPLNNSTGSITYGQQIFLPIVDKPNVGINRYSVVASLINSRESDIRLSMAARTLVIRGAKDDRN